MDDTTTNDDMAQLEDELAQIKAERARVAQKREAIEAATEKRAQIERERQALADDEAIAKLEETHGPIDAPGSKLARFNTALGVIVVKRPASHLFRKFQSAKGNDAEEVEKLVRPCVVHPSKARFDDMLEELPGILTNLGDAVAHLAGVRVNELRGKS